MSRGKAKTSGLGAWGCLLRKGGEERSWGGEGIDISDPLGNVVSCLIGRWVDDLVIPYGSLVVFVEASLFSSCSHPAAK